MFPAKQFYRSPLTELKLNRNNPKSTCFGQMTPFSTRFSIDEARGGHFFCWEHSICSREMLVVKYYTALLRLNC